MKNQKSRKGLVVSLVLSLVANVVLLAGICIIGGPKTHFFSRMGERMGICEMNPINRGDYWCNRGWTNTLNKLGYDADVVFFGNSITCGGNFQDYFLNVHTCNLGYPGDNLDGMMLRISQIKAVKPEKVFVMAGINGLQYQTEAVFEKKYQHMVDSIKNVVPEAVVYLQSILPVNHEMKNGVASKEKIRKANEIVADIARRSGCVYVDLYALYEKGRDATRIDTRRCTFKT